MKKPEKKYRHEEIIKKSRFIVTILPLENSDDFPVLLKKHVLPSASHNCWAWKADKKYRFSDDGEPAGTAGMPIFRAIDSGAWNNIAIIVTRYFGGIKLGTGGLARAYGGTTARALQQAPFMVIVQKVSLEISAGHDDTGIIFSLMKKYNITDEAISYTAEGIIIKIQIVPERAEPFTEACKTETAGRAAVAIKDL